MDDSISGWGSDGTLKEVITMSYTAPGQGGVGGSVAYYLYYNGVFEGMVSPADAGNFEGNWAQAGISSAVVSNGSAAGSNGPSAGTSGPPVTPGTNPADGTRASSTNVAAQSTPTPAVDSHSVGSKSGPSGAAPGSTPAIADRAGSAGSAGAGSASRAASPSPSPSTGSKVDVKL